MPAIFHVSSQIDRGSAYCFGACSVSLTVCLLSKLTSSFTRVLLFFLRLASGEKSILITKQLSKTSIPMTSSSSNSSTAVLSMKLMWNSPVDAEKTYDTVFAELMTRLVYESVDYVSKVADADDAISPAPAPAVGAALNANAARQANHDKTVLKVNADSRKAMGILMGLFNPDSNAHRSLIGWFNEPLVGLTALQMRRKDFNFRNAFEKWQTEYKPNKQFNYDTILKMWEALSDREMPFAEFWGQWHKLYKELEDIGHPPSEEKCYEMLRRSVTNVNLRQFVIQLDLPPAVRLSIASFFEYCLYVTRTQKEFDTGHGNGKRKHEDETIVGRTVTLLKKSKSDANSEPICWRCGEAGHIRYNNATGARCHASVCTLCHSNIGGDLHDARVCCNRSHQVFAGRNFKSPKQGKREKNNASSTQPKGKRGKRDIGKEKATNYYGAGNNHSSSTSATSSSIPKELQQARALVASLEAAYHARSNTASARRVTSAEDSDR